MERFAKKALAVTLAFIMVFGGAPLGALAGFDFKLPEWLKSPFSLGASAAGGVWDGSVAAGFASGSGTEGDPYIIETAPQLAFLSSSVNSGTTYDGKFIKLTDDIELNSPYVFAYDGDGNITGKAAGKTPNEWTAIGTSYNNSFNGNFDGDGHTVSGIYIDTASDYQGLFGYVFYVFKGTIKNVGVVDSYIKGGNYVGGVAGDSGGTVSNCYNTGSVTGSEYVGGVV
ncbi:MAG: hypothetical protein GX107_05295, partial [Clostridiales bacterium]|nr:hypothetical protein [Clostridiales bacterium]